MGEYQWCISCGNKKENEDIYRCNNCAHVFCKSCQKEVFMAGVYVYYCPKCNASSRDKIGQIQKA